MSKTINLGAVTAYADAVAAGYTGTREQFAQDLANAATYAAESHANAEAASDAAETATAAASAASLDADAAHDDAASAHADAEAALSFKTAAETAAGTATTKAGEAANSASQAATSASGAAGSATAASGSATAAAGSATNAAASETAAAGSATAAAGSASAAAQTLVDVNAAGATQIAAIGAKGEEVLESIPSDYTGLSQDVDDLKSDLGDLGDLETTDKSSVVAAINEAASSGGGLTSDVKTALLQLASKVAYIDADGQDYYDDLYAALYDTEWSVTITLIGCSSNNYVERIRKDASYSATITAYSGYTLTGATVAITMGGVDVTSTVYSNGVITIASVTGALVISVIADALTVSSISSVYTPSNVVYPYSDLDDLNDDIVVTATYSDGSTGTVPENDYTLSGELAAGTSTITVSYSGYTTTFSVTVSAGVPAEYTAYDYITLPANKSNVASDKWIILKAYTDLNAVSCDFRFCPMSTETGPALFGHRTVDGNTQSFAFYHNASNKLGWHLHGSGPGSVVTPDVTYQEVNRIRYYNTIASPSSLQVDSNALTYFEWASATLSMPNVAPVMFCNPVNNTSSNLIGKKQLGKMKFYDLNGTLISFYVAAVRTEDNRIGMYDLVDGTFYTTSSANYSTVGNSNCYYAVGNWS